MKYPPEKECPCCGNPLYSERQEIKDNSGCVMSVMHFDQPVLNESAVKPVARQMERHLKSTLYLKLTLYWCCQRCGAHWEHTETPA
jgi:hypothetical protein